MRCRKSIVSCLALVVAWTAIPQGGAVAIQPDAPFMDHARKNRDRWIQEDRQINAKLAALRKAKAATKTQLVTAQKSLAGDLNSRQIAQCVMMGILD